MIYPSHKNKCPLCLSADIELIFTSTRKDLNREYLTCKFCGLVFVPRFYHLTFSEQRDRYLEHNNSPTDPDYRKFLARLKDQIVPFLAFSQKGLDYGSGPGPTLSLMLEEDGFKMDLFDPMFANHRENLEKCYDFVVSTETVEHFTHPVRDFQILYDLLKPCGIIGIMTSILYPKIDFDDWYYRLDPTHVSFYRPITMEYIADHWQLECSSPSENVYIFRK